MVEEKGIYIEVIAKNVAKIEVTVKKKIVVASFCQHKLLSGTVLLTVDRKHPFPHSATTGNNVTKCY